MTLKLIRSTTIFFFSLFVIFTLSRTLIRTLPGDPIETMSQETGSNLSLDTLRHELQLDQPFWPATFHEFKNALHGDFGRSILSREPISKELFYRTENTFKLAFYSLFIGITFGFILGVFSPYSRVVNEICTWFGAITSALPSPWIGPILAWLLGVKLRWFQISGNVVLPSIVLSLGIIGMSSRLIRERITENMRSVSAQAARARGLSESRVLVKYILAPVSGVLFSYFGSVFAVLFTGTFVTEILFNWPGLGSLLVESILKRDYPVFETTLFVAASISLFFHRLGDAMQVALNQKKGETP